MEAQAAPFQLSIDLLALGSSSQLWISKITIFPQMKSPTFVPELQKLQLLWLRVDLGPPVYVTGSSQLCWFRVLRSSMAIIVGSVSSYRHRFAHMAHSGSYNK